METPLRYLCKKYKAGGLWHLFNKKQQAGTTDLTSIWRIPNECVDMGMDIAKRSLSHSGAQTTNGSSIWNKGWKLDDAVVDASTSGVVALDGTTSGVYSGGSHPRRTIIPTEMQMPSNMHDCSKFNNSCMIYDMSLGCPNEFTISGCFRVPTTTIDSDRVLFGLYTTDGMYIELSTVMFNSDVNAQLTVSCDDNVDSSTYWTGEGYQEWTTSEADPPPSFFSGYIYDSIYSSGYDEYDWIARGSAKTVRGEPRLGMVSKNHPASAGYRAWTHYAVTVSETRISAYKNGILWLRFVSHPDENGFPQYPPFLFNKSINTGKKRLLSIGAAVTPGGLTAGGGLGAGGTERFSNCDCFCPMVHSRMLSHMEIIQLSRGLLQSTDLTMANSRNLPNRPGRGPAVFTDTQVQVHNVFNRKYKEYTPFHRNSRSFETTRDAHGTYPDDTNYWQNTPLARLQSSDGGSFTTEMWFNDQSTILHPGSGLVDKFPLYSFSIDIFDLFIDNMFIKTAQGFKDSVPHVLFDLSNIGWGWQRPGGGLGLSGYGKMGACVYLIKRGANTDKTGRANTIELELLWHSDNEKKPWLAQVVADRAASVDPITEQPNPYAGNEVLVTADTVPAFRNFKGGHLTVSFGRNETAQDCTFVMLDGKVIYTHPIETVDKQGLAVEYAITPGILECAGTAHTDGAQTAPCGASATTNGGVNAVGRFGQIAFLKKYLSKIEARELWRYTKVYRGLRNSFCGHRKPRNITIQRGTKTP